MTGQSDMKSKTLPNLSKRIKMKSIIVCLVAVVAHAVELEPASAGKGQDKSGDSLGFTDLSQLGGSQDSHG